MPIRRQVAVGLAIATGANGVDCNDPSNNLCGPIPADGWGQGGDICGKYGTDGYIHLAHFSASPTGDCSATGGAPTKSLKYRPHGFAAISSSTPSGYLTNNNEIDEVTNEYKAYGEANVKHVTPTMAANSNPTWTLPGGAFKYGEVRGFTYVGSMTAWAMLGTASYLGLENSINFKDMSFLRDTNLAGPRLTSAGDYTSTELTTEDGVCITGPGACTNTRTASAGTFKYSIYGVTGGSNFVTTVANYTYFGLRNQVVLTSPGFIPEVSVNGGAFQALDGTSLTAAGGVTSMKVKIAEGEIMDWTFPTKYYYGDASAGGDAWKAAMSEGTITINVAPSSANTFFMDFVFNMNDVKDGPGRVFVYDPDITVSTGGSSGASAVGLSIFAAAIGSLAVMF